jgi:hypothetical protein
VQSYDFSLVQNCRELSNLWRQVLSLGQYVMTIASVGLFTPHHNTKRTHTSRVEKCSVRSLSSDRKQSGGCLVPHRVILQR